MFIMMMEAEIRFVFNDAMMHLEGCRAFKSAGSRGEIVGLYVET